MKVPAQIKAFCTKCRTHTLHEVTLYKKGKARALAKGARHHERELKGYGGQKFPEQRVKSKTTEKKSLKLKCTICGRIHHRKGIRLKKLEIVR